VKPDCPHLSVGYLDPFGIGLGRDFGADTEAGLSVGITNTLEQDIQRSQRNAGPLTTDGTEQAMFHRIPFRGPGGIVAQRNAQAERIGQFGLDFLLEQSRATIVAAAGIGQDQQPITVGIVPLALGPPPVSDRIDGKLGRVGRRAYVDQAVIASDVIDAIGGGDPFGILSKIVCVHLDRSGPPSTAVVFERTDQFFLLGIDADDGIARLEERFLLFLKVVELSVAVRVRRAGEAFAVRLQRKPFF